MSEPVNKSDSIKLIADQSEAADKEINQWEEEALRRVRARSPKLAIYGTKDLDLDPTNKDRPDFHHISPFLTDEDIKILIKQSNQLEQIFDQLETKLIGEDETTEKLQERASTLSKDNVRPLLIDLSVTISTKAHFERKSKQRFANARPCRKEIP